MDHAPAPSTSTRDRSLAGGLLGLVTGGVAIGAAHLVAGLVDPEASPVVAVGQAAIDVSPQWLKSWAIRSFGSANKLVLLTGIGIVLVLASIALGIASVRRVRVGLVGLGAFAAVGLVAVLTRPAAEPVDALPTIVGAAAGGVTLLWLHRRAFPTVRAEPSPEAEARVDLDRRRLLVAAAAGGVAAALAGGVGSFLGRRSRADASRADVRIPAPSSRAPSAEGSELAVEGLEPFFTPNDGFYRVDTALVVPSVEAEDWQLRIHGMVEREIVLDYERLLARPLIERDITLACVSNPVGGRFVGNGRWVGVHLGDLLEEAGVAPSADQIVSRSIDGFTAGTPTGVAMDGRDAMLAVAMNGEPLPLEHGFPVRMIVPGLYGYVSATKWLVDIELTTFDAFDPYWIERGWAERAPIKTMSRIDTPVWGAELPAGRVPVAGVAWAQHRGIERVELQVDEGPWVEADLAAVDTVDTWRQWVVMWDATPGEHTLQVRATDGTGETQTAARVEPFPDGATGYHMVRVRVA